MVWINNGDEYLDEVSNWRTILGVCLVLPVVTTTIVGLRGYVRGRMLRSLGPDDFVIFGSAVGRILSPGIYLFVDCCKVCGIIYAGLCIGQSKWGLGLPIKLRPKPNLNEYSVVS